MPSVAVWNRTLYAIAALTLALGACDDGDDDETDGGTRRDAGVDVDVDSGGADMDAGDDDEDAGGDDEDAGRDVDSGGDPGPDAGSPPIGGGAATSAQITAVLAAPEGPTDLPIEGAIVTYVKPALGGDLPGFFLQAERMGPALFVAVDPAGLSPSPAAGQVVDLRATDLSERDTNQGRREVVAIDGWSVVSSGNDIGFLVQDVSGVDLIAMLDAYEMELVSTSFEIRSIYRFAGEGYQQISIDTPAVVDIDAISLRVPDALVSALDLELNCRYTLSGTPLWRDFGIVQVSAFETSEVSLVECDPPQPILADARNERSLVVRFNRVLDGSSVMASGAQFTIEHAGGADIAVSAAVAGDNYVILTTEADLAAGAFYTITVATSVLDSRGTGVPAGSMIMSEGYTPHIVINEVDYDMSGGDTREFVELYNAGLSPISLSGLTLYTVDIVDGVGSVNEMVELVPNSEDVTELAGGAYLIVTTPSGALTPPPGVPTVELGGNLQDEADGVLLSSADVCHDAVFYEGRPTTPETLAGCAFEAVAGTDEGDLALSRIPNGADFDENSVDFRPMSPTPGAAN